MNKRIIIIISTLIGVLLIGIITFLIINHNNEVEERMNQLEKENKRLEKEKQDKEKIEIPYLTMYTEEKAKEVLKSLDPSITIKIELVEDEEVPVGHVVKTSPEAGRKQDIGSEITLYISTRKPIEIKIIDEIKEYDYSISNIDTDYYKKEFKKLKEILNNKTIDNEKYAEYVARLFIIDLYTINTKTNKYDVGGIEYLYADQKEKFKNKVIDTLYANIEDNTYGDREQKLPEVKTMETISVKETTYQLSGNTVNGYEIKLRWNYITNMGYDSEGTIIVVQQNGSKKWAVVDYQNKI